MIVIAKFEQKFHSQARSNDFIRFNPMKNSLPSSLNLLSTAALLTMLGVAAVTVLSIDLLLQRWLAIALLGSFGGLAVWLPRDDEAPRLSHINLALAVQSGLLVALLVFFPQSSALIILFYILSVEAMLYNPLQIGLLWLLGFISVVAVYLLSQLGLSQGLGNLASFAGGLLLFGLVSGSLSSARQAQRRS